MATIRTRKKADGSTGYLVQIRIYREKVTVYQESQTFARKQAAVAWAKRRETKLAEPGAIERATRVGHTVKQMIDRYLMEVEKARPLGETKRRMLNAIKNNYLGEKVHSDISQQVLVDCALWRMSHARMKCWRTWRFPRRIDSSCTAPTRLSGSTPRSSVAPMS